MPNRKILFTSLSILIIAGFFITNNQQPITTQERQQGQSVQSKLPHQTETSQNYKALAAQNNQQKPKVAVQKEPVPSIDMDRKFQKISALLANYPQSEPQLIEWITKPDSYKAKDRQAPPHSLDEINQHRLGALKVLALREILTKQTSQDQLQNKLHIIIQQAQDPTIVNIAKTALESSKKGRSFFDDFLSAIDQMSL